MAALLRLRLLTVLPLIWFSYFSCDWRMVHGISRWFLPGPFILAGAKAIPHEGASALVTALTSFALLWCSHVHDSALGFPCTSVMLEVLYGL